MSIISTGGTYRIFDDGVATHDRLPGGTYRVDFAPMQGFYLTRIPDITASAEPVYGDHGARLDRVLRGWRRSTRSLGLILSGDKGMGKSLFVRMLADAFHASGTPVIVVDHAYPGLAAFIDTIEGESLVIFDEFEKVFAETDDRNPQHELLSLFDGLSGARRMYAITVNDLRETSAFILNRPGRFHYHVRFSYPDQAETRTYLRDHVAQEHWGEVEAAVEFSVRVPLNYDCLRAIAFELDSGEKFAEVIGDLNIKRTETPSYRVSVSVEDGRTFVGSLKHDFSAEPDVLAWLTSGGERSGFTLYVDESTATWDESGRLHVTRDGLRLFDSDEDGETPVSAVLTRQLQREIGY